MTCAGTAIGPYGSSFDDFLAEHGILEETHKQAANDVVGWQLRQATEEVSTTKSEAARHLPAALDDQHPSGE